MYNLGIMRRLPSDCAFTSMDSPAGTLTLIASNRGLHALLFDVETTICRDGFNRFIANDNHPVLRRSREQLSEYFSGMRRHFDLLLAMEGTEFQRQVWNLLVEIPYGAVATYGDLALKMGSANRARAVGAANAVNPIAVIVPCHRVIGRNGALTGFGGGLDKKRLLIDLEQEVLLGHRAVATAPSPKEVGAVAAGRISSG